MRASDTSTEPSARSATTWPTATSSATLHAAAPDVELTLTDMHPDVALRRLREGAIDVAVVFRYDDAGPEDIHLRHLFDDPMHLVSRQAGESLADHRDSPWIAGCERCRQELVDACQAAGFTPRIAYTSDDPIVEQALVAAGLGVTTIPGLLLKVHRAPGVETTKLPDPRRRIYVATYGEPPHPPATEAFVDAVVEASATL